MDKPSSVESDQTATMIDGVAATMFDGSNAIMSDTREIWFIKPTVQQPFNDRSGSVGTAGTCFESCRAG